MQDVSSRAATATQCMSCKVTGTVVCLSCSGYLGAQLYARPAAMPKLHRYTMIAFAAGFAIMGVARAVT